MEATPGHPLPAVREGGVQAAPEAEKNCWGPKLELKRRIRYRVR